MIADFLYSLQPQEAASAPVLQRFTRRSFQNVAAAAIFVDFFPDGVPLDKIVLVQSISALIAGGAAQSPVLLTVRIQDQAFNVLHEWRDEPLSRFNAAAPAASAFDINLFALDWLLMPGEHLEVNGSFSAGVAANVFQATTIGFFFPKGTMQLR